MSKKVITGVTLALAALMALTMAAPAHAGAGASGGKFACYIVLDQFPALGRIVNSTNCTNPNDPAKVSTATTITAAGVDDNNAAYAFSANGFDNFSATANYTEICAASVPGPPLVGFADGHVTITGTAVRSPSVSEAAELHSDYNWSRVGATAVVTQANGHVRFASGDRATGLETGVSVAAFEPKGGTNPCTVVPGPQQAVEVIGLFAAS